MIDIEGADKKVKQVDSLLTSIKALLKKHWFFIILILFAIFAYYAVILPADPAVDQTEQVAPADDDTTDDSQ